MVSASTSARGNKSIVCFFVLLTAVVLYACKTPLELDVDRTKAYTDGAVHPMRLSMFYYFGDSAYEAIVTDTAFLNTIWIEKNSTPYRLTIPRLEFSLPDTIRGSSDSVPFVRKFCFATDNTMCNGVYSMCITANSWVAGEYLTPNNLLWIPFLWPTDDKGRQIRMAFYEVREEHLIKGSFQILVADPNVNRYASNRALMTIEY
ncbi:MAG: hypothetical protein NTX15_03095 [Candidatus Kapabacteria bacterium]|nr:hypothetical protein [Candidatus Kapabacteria bacterium]